jgi:hypothetical protein
VPLVLVALGTAIRLRQYVGGRSLWLDEAFLAESLTTRGPIGLVSEPLENSQSAPLGWLLGVRLALAVFGQSEQALRLVPLLCGLAALPLTWLLARRLLAPAVVPVAVGLVALSPQLIGYSNELKPYSADVAAVLLIGLLAVRAVTGDNRSDRRLWQLTAVGAVVVWFSTIALLAMAAVSVGLVVRALVTGGWLTGGRRAAVRTALVLAPSTLAGGAVYLVLTGLQKNALLIDYWAPTFPQGAGDLPFWLGRTARDLIASPLALVQPVLAGLLLGVGTARLLWSSRWAGGLVLAAVPAGVLAAAMSAYPLASRLALWLVPLAALVLAAALPSRLTMRSLPWLLASVVALATVSGPALRQGLELGLERTDLQELEPVLRELVSQQQPGDVVLIDRSVRAPFTYYERTIPGLERQGILGLRAPSPPCDDAAVLQQLGFASGRVWLVFSHQSPGGVSRASREEVPRRIAAVADLERVLEAPGAAAYLYTPRADPAPTVTDDPSRCLVAVPG